MCPDMKGLKHMLIVVLMSVILPLQASEAHHDSPQDSEIDVGEMLFGHIGDSYGWHITDWGGKHVTIPLPCIVYSRQTGWHCFMSTRVEHGHEYKGFSIAEEGRYKDKIVETGSDGEQIRPFDISITKNVCSLIFTGLLLISLVLSAAGWYRRHDASEEAPGGFTGLVEMMVVMVNDDLIRPSVGEKDYRKYAPYLLTIHQQPSGYCAVLPRRSKCDGKYSRDPGSGHVYLCGREPVRQQALLEGDSVAGCSGLPEVPDSDNADYRAVWLDSKAFLIDGQAVC